MRYKIEYYYRSEDNDTPFWAKTEINDKFICSCGESWEDVRVKHVQRLTEKVKSPEPPIAEEIDL